MAPKEKEPNRHQLSSRLSYQQNVPSFLLKLQNRVKGITTADDDDEPQYSYRDDYDRGDRGSYYQDGEGEEYYNDGSGRPPIPQRPRDERPSIPERPDDDPGSADEDDGDEKPQVVVLKEGKHLTEWEAENVRRKERGLDPLPDPNAAAGGEHTTSDSKVSSSEPKQPVKKSKELNTGLSFSSSGGSGFNKTKKRKIIDTDPDFEQLKESVSGKNDREKANKPSKKPKKEKKTLLSFGEEA